MNTEQPKKNNVPRFNLTWIYVIVGGVLIYLLLFGDNRTSASKDTNFTNFKIYVSNGYADRIVVNKTDGTATMEVKNEYVKKIFKQGVSQTGVSPTVVTKYPTVDKIEEFLDAETRNGHFKGTVTYEETNNFFLNLLGGLLPIIVLVAIYLFFFRRMSGGGSGGGGVFSVGKSKAKLFEKGSGLHVTFKDVAGQEGAKQEVQEIVEFLKNPRKYTELGGKIPKGALLVGPPGTGKTLLAKAVAGEADVPFFSMSGSDFVEMFVGVGASRVRDLFAQAKAKAPCIIFIDEIDAVGRARGKNPAFGGNDERENTLNQLLTEMDGFGTNSGVIILAATNRVDILDKALLRAGRFDRQIHVDLPDLPERVAIFGVHMRPLKLDDTVDVDLLARQTPGFSGADIANVCNEAALIAARHDKAAVGKQDFLSAIDRIIGGLEKKTKIMTSEEKRTIALHEAGHATVSWFLKYANPLVKVTIVPRGQALGAAWYLPEERTIVTKEQMLDEICATLGGRAAEELFTGHISSGALNDLETVTKRSYGMVAYMGMSDKLSNLCYYNNQEYQFDKPYSDKTAELIDEEVKKQIAEQYERAKSLLTEHAEGHAQLAQRLIEKEVIFAEDVEEIFGKRPWMSRADELLADEQNRKAIEAVSLGTDKEAGKNEPTAETDEAATASADSEKAENNRPSSADESTSEMENNGMTPSEK
jgi:ATP-dependent metallopeptidase hflB